VSVHGPPWLHFDTDPDLDPVSDFDMMRIDLWLAFHSGAGPVSKMMRIRIRNTDLINLNKLFGSAALLCFFVCHAYTCLGYTLPKWGGPYIVYSYIIKYR